MPITYLACRSALIDDFVALGFLPAGCDRGLIVPVMDRVLSPYLRGGGAAAFNFQALSQVLHTLLLLFSSHLMHACMQNRGAPPLMCAHLDVPWLGGDGGGILLFGVGVEGGGWFSDVMQKYSNIQTVQLLNTSRFLCCYM